MGDTAMRVAYILHRFPYITETFILREMRQLEREAVHVDVFSLLPPKATVMHKEARALLDSTTYAPFMAWSVLMAQVHYVVHAPLRYLSALLGTISQTYREPRVMLLMLALFPKCVYFARVMERKTVQHVHAHFVWLEGVAASIISELTGLTYTITPHAFGLFTRDHACVASELKRATHIVTISEYNRRFIASLLPGLPAAKITVVHCGIDTRLWRPVSDRGGSRPVTILSIGRAIEKKGHDDLLTACALLAERGVRFKCLILAGDEASVRGLRKLIDLHALHEYVELLGPRDEDGTRELYNLSDIFALASRIARSGDRDGIPVVLMEAMACGLPVVSTEVSGIPELVQHEGCGLLVPPGHPRELASALQTLIEDPKLRSRMGSRGRAQVEAEFRIDQTVARLASVFRQVWRNSRWAPDNLAAHATSVAKGKRHRTDLQPPRAR